MINASREMFETALTYSEKVYFITEPVAYDENELPGVSERWALLFSIDKNLRSGTEKDLFLDNRSYAELIRMNNKLLSRVAREYEIKTIDLDSYLRQYLSRYDDLFYNRQHLTPKGAELAAKYIHSEM